MPRLCTCGKICGIMARVMKMKQIRYKDIKKIDKYWIFYRDVEMGDRHIDLEACANSFARSTGFEVGEDGLRCVGYRYKVGGTGCYELFIIGHLEVRCGGLKNLFNKDAWLELEEKLNAGGYKTLEK